MRPRTLRIALTHLLISPLCNGVGHRFQLPLRGHRQQLHLRGALQVIEVVPGFGDGRRGNDHTVVFQEQNVSIAHDTGDAVAF
ncbi:hypothetical protein D3C87_584520 [compost metagenome]